MHRDIKNAGHVAAGGSSNNVINDIDAIKRPSEITHSKHIDTPKQVSLKGPPFESSSTIQDIEDASSGGPNVARARAAMLDKMRAASGYGGASASATVQEFHRYLEKLRGEEDGPFQCLVAALLRLEFRGRA